MSAVGWLHAALLQGELSLGCRFRLPQPSNRSLGCHIAPKVYANRERCGLGRVDGRYCANVLYSSARIEAAGEPAGYCGPLVEQVCAAAFELVNLMPPQELATLAWSLALLGVLPAPQLLARLVANVLRKLPGFKPQDVVMALAALPQLRPHNRVAPYSTVHHLAGAALRVLPQASAGECGLLLAALAGVGFKPSGAWLAGWWAGSEAKLGGMAPAELGMTGWALGRLAPLEEGPPASWLAAWQHALQQTCIHGSSSSSSHSSSNGQLCLMCHALQWVLVLIEIAWLALVRLVWCLGKLGYRPAGGALTGWLAARLAGSSSSSSAGVPLSSYSASQLALLLSGLRGCRVVLGGRWLAQLLAHSTDHARQMPLEVGGLFRVAAAAAWFAAWSAAALHLAATCGMRGCVVS
ncbi:hypothetical protein OEZ85_012575 [Tetradesmus obliquus]|uniref:Uncharacterized protein n=1 Tax=Tetradesmus obliquus TaxID=3088 RepID=A0ABY8U391_TETOB|nr:hypothetical protein OEZ85_012575 [Tetradesmus obliquus]